MTSEWVGADPTAISILVMRSMLGAFDLAGAGLNGGLELDERGRRQKNGILVGLDPVS